MSLLSPPSTKLEVSRQLSALMSGSIKPTSDSFSFPYRCKVAILFQITQLDQSSAKLI